jgi:hypothetical protein
MKPKVVRAPAASDLFQAALRTVTAVPVGVTRPPHRLPMVWPAPDVHVTAQPGIAAGPAWTVTSPWKPPVHSPTTRYVAEHALTGSRGGRPGPAHSLPGQSHRADEQQRGDDRGEAWATQGGFLSGHVRAPVGCTIDGDH